MIKTLILWSLLGIMVLALGTRYNQGANRDARQFVVTRGMEFARVAPTEYRGDIARTSFRAANFIGDWQAR